VVGFRCRCRLPPSFFSLSISMLMIENGSRGYSPFLFLRSGREMLMDSFFLPHFFPHKGRGQCLFPIRLSFLLFFEVPLPFFFLPIRDGKRCPCCLPPHVCPLSSPFLSRTSNEAFLFFFVDRRDVAKSPLRFLLPFRRSLFLSFP